MFGWLRKKPGPEDVLEENQAEAEVGTKEKSGKPMRLMVEGTDGKLREETSNPGLRRIFGVGEYLPWKGIALRVEAVDYDSIRLRYSGITQNRANLIEKQKVKA